MKALLGRFSIFAGTIFTLSVSLPAPAEGTKVAAVLACHGAEVRSGLSLLHPLSNKEKLDRGLSLNLPGSGKVELLFYSDGHHEEIQGPCLVRVDAEGCRVIHGGAACLARVVAEKRQLVLPQGETMQTVGGNIAGISDPSMVKGTSPATAVGKMIEPLPASKELELSFFQNKGQVTISRSGGGSRLKFVLKGADADLPVTMKNGRVIFPHLVEDNSYCLWAYLDDQPRLCLPFRVLHPAEEAELARLNGYQSPGDAALVIDRLDELGLPSVAAQKAELLLQSVDYRDAGLLNYLYHLYDKVLFDNLRARRIQARAKQLHYPLVDPTAP